MKLSTLAFNSVKSVKFMDNPEFNLVGFRNREFDNDIDYSASILHCFSSLNRAIHRLSDRNKIPFKCEKISKNANTNIFNFKEQGLKIKTIKNVVSLDETYGRYIHYPFREMGNGCFMVIGCIAPNEVYVEYVEDIPNFDSEDFDYRDDDEIKDVELGDYGINDTMCSYIELFVKGELFTTISPELSFAFVNRAEQAFADLDDYSTAFGQQTIKPRIKVGA